MYVFYMGFQLPNIYLNLVAILGVIKTSIFHYNQRDIKTPMAVLVPLGDLTHTCAFHFDCSKLLDYAVKKP